MVENINYNNPPQHFCITSHIFGAKSFACIASFAIHCAIDAAEKKGKIAENSAENARKNFNVDDFLSSNDSIQNGIRIAHEITDTVMKREFRLTKWLSNERGEIGSFEKDERAEAVKELSIDDSLP